LSDIAQNAACLINDARLVVRLRPSNTEPVLRLNLEADNELLMIEKRDALLAQIGGR
jgi:phosphomannomutase